MRTSSRKISAGLLMFRLHHGEPEVFLAHPGGPYFQRKDEGYWTIPKGETDPDEDYLQAAIREFAEEIGQRAHGPFFPLGEIVQKGGKVVHAWGFSGIWQDGQLPKSNTFAIEWPPRSGQQQNFPEIDRARFFSLSDAYHKLKEAQHPFLDRLQTYLRGRGQHTS